MPRYSLRSANLPSFASSSSSSAAASASSVMQAQPTSVVANGRGRKRGKSQNVNRTKDAKSSRSQQEAKQQDADANDSHSMDIEVNSPVVASPSSVPSSSSSSSSSSSAFSSGLSLHASRGFESDSDEEDGKKDVSFITLIKIAKDSGLPQWSDQSVAHDFLRTIAAKMDSSGYSEDVWIRLLPHFFNDKKYLDKVE